MSRQPWHQRAGARLPAGPRAGVRRSDGGLETTRQGPGVAECFRCAEVGEIDADRARMLRRLRLFPVRVLREKTTLGSTLLCARCIGGLTPLDPDPLTVPEDIGA